MVFKDRRLDSLDPRFRPVAMELLARLTEMQIAVMIINTGRTPAEQSEALAHGVSWVTHSKHEDGLAIDIALYDWWQLHGPKKLYWGSTDPLWQRMGEIGEKLGLGWGGRWPKQDLGHFEWIEPVYRRPFSTLGIAGGGEENV